MNIYSQGDNRSLGISLIFAACLLFSIQDSIVRSLVGSIFPAQVMVFQFLGLFIYSLVSAYIKGIKIFNANLVHWQILRAIVLSVEAILFFFAIQGLTLASLHSIFTLTPIIITLIAVIFLKEQAKKSTWVSIFIAFSGALIIVRPGLIEISKHTLIALCGVWLWSFYQILSRIIGDRDKIEISLMFICSFALFTALGLCAINYSQITMPQGDEWLKLAALVVISVASFSMQILAYRYAPANVLQPFNYTTFVFAVLFGYIFFNDLPDKYTVIGALIIILSGLFILLKDIKKNKLPT